MCCFMETFVFEVRSTMHVEWRAGSVQIAFSLQCPYVSDDVAFRLYKTHAGIFVYMLGGLLACFAMWICRCVHIFLVPEGRGVVPG